jgi:pimeloyl-ACP methyl ester carboxylesterase
MQPEIRYARSGEVSIAFQVVGEGPPDLVYVHGFISNLGYAWEQPIVVEHYLGFASFSRLIVFDRRGIGLSDRVREVPTLETRMDDIRAVMDAAGSKRAVLFGRSEGGPTSALFAATYPERTAALVTYGSYARGVRGPDYPWGPSEEEAHANLEEIRTRWGEPAYFDELLREAAPSVADDEDVRRWWRNYCRLALSPAAAVAAARMAFDADVTDVLPAIRVPTLVLHRSGDEPGHSRYIAERIPNARFIELPGAEHSAFIDPTGSVVAEVEQFVRGLSEEPRVPDRVLATVLFTDIVGSTERGAEIGDAAWREVVQRHHAAVRRRLSEFRGEELDTAGDGFFAAFDGPGRAIACACAIRDAVRSLGVEIRAGVHTGECERVDGKLGGIAVPTGARIASLAEPGEVLVSSTVKDLVVGSGLDFSERGEHELKGVPGAWRVFAVA